MNTPAHLILGAAICARPPRKGILAAAILGGLAPDLSLYLLAGFALFVQQIPPQIVFDELYFSELWQAVFAVDNSFFVWGGLILLAAWRQWPLLLAFAAAGFLHIALDFPLHHDDGRPHFWPLTGWVFESPISYWDIRRGAQVIAPLEGALCAFATIALWRRFPSILARAGFTALLLLELWVIRGWYLFAG
ncbi:MAG: cobalamin biosynthesis protein CobQ [Pseudomonadota bacterium]